MYWSVAAIFHLRRAVIAAVTGLEILALADECQALGHQ